MTKYSKKLEQKYELADEFKPNIRDAIDLNAKLSKYSPIKLNGRIQYPFFQYLAEQGVIRFGEKGEPIILKVSEFHRLNQLNDLAEWKRDKDLLADFEQFPEEKEIHEARVEKIREEVRGILKGKRIGALPEEAK